MTIARRLIGYNLLTGIVFGVIGWYVGWYGAHAIVGPSLDYFGDIDYNELSVFLAYLGGVIGFLIGLGFLHYPIQRLRGYPPSLREKETEGIGRYFSLCTDHKVVGIQYLVMACVLFAVGGLAALLGRATRPRQAPPRAGAHGEEAEGRAPEGCRVGDEHLAEGETPVPGWHLAVAEHLEVVALQGARHRGRQAGVLEAAPGEDHRPRAHPVGGRLADDFALALQ